MTIIEQFNLGFPPMVADIPEGGIRVIAGLIEVKGGLVFADVFWSDAIGRHPFHFLEGKVTGSGPWKIGKVVIRLLKDGKDGAGDWNSWYPYRDENPALRGVDATATALRRWSSSMSLL